MMMFVEPELLEAARAVARALVQSGEHVAELPIEQSGNVPAAFLVRRDLVRGFLPIAKVEVEGEVFYVGGDTGRR